MTQTDQPPTLVYSGERAVSLTSDPVFTALSSDKSYHRLYMLYRLLEKLNGTGVLMPTNRELAEQLDLHRDTVQGMMAVLERLGLVHVQQAPNQSRVLVVPQPSPRTVAALAAVKAGQLKLDIRLGRVVGTTTGREFEPEVLSGTYGPQTVGGGNLRSPDLRTYGPQTVGTLRSPDLRSDVSTAPPTGSVVPPQVTLDSSAIYEIQEKMLEEQLSSNSHIAPQSSSSEPSPSDGLLSPSTHGGARPGAGSAEAPVTDEMRAVHAGWLAATAPRIKVPLRGRMASKIRARLGDGFSVEDLVTVAQWAAADAYMSGNHPNNATPYLSVETLYRSTAKTTDFLMRAKAWEAKGRPKGAAGLDQRRGTQSSATRPVTNAEMW